MKVNKLAFRENRRQPKPADPTHQLQSGHTPMELAEIVRTSIREAKEYARWRRLQWSTRATIAQVSIFGLSAASTLALGMAERDTASTVGFICSALVSAGAAIEPYFNWRSRWVNSEEALASWHKLEDELFVYIASCQENEIDPKKILEFDIRRSDIWNKFSEKWITQRKSDKI